MLLITTNECFRQEYISANYQFQLHFRIFHVGWNLVSNGNFQFILETPFVEPTNVQFQAKFEEQEIMGYTAGYHSMNSNGPYQQSSSALLKIYQIYLNPRGHRSHGGRGGVEIFKMSEVLGIHII